MDPNAHAAGKGQNEPPAALLQGVTHPHGRHDKPTKDCKKIHDFGFTCNTRDLTERAEGAQSYRKIIFAGQKPLKLETALAEEYAPIFFT